MTYRIAMIDDEELQIREMERVLARYNAAHPETKFVLESFLDPAPFLEKFRSDYDVVFLDISMPGISGMDVARRIRETDGEVLILFITNMAQYALESYDVHAFDFIIKPIEYDAFAMKFDRVRSELSHRLTTAEITVSFGANTSILRVREIAYVEVLNHNTVIHMTAGEEYRLRCSLGELERQLAPYHFVRCNSCYLVNLGLVKEVRGEYVTVDRYDLRISHLKRPAFLGALAEYLGNSV